MALMNARQNVEELACRFDFTYYPNLPMPLDSRVRQSLESGAVNLGRVFQPH